VSTQPSSQLAEHYHRVVRELVDAHARRTEEPLVLAIRYQLDDPSDIYLLEVLEEFPGNPDDPPFTTEFGPTAELVILGKLHLALTSSAQLRAAIDRGDPIVGAVRRDGEVLYPLAASRSSSRDATDLIAKLGLR
jgi:hypothetical protein